jgi:glycosyltransferase involved in cell wall biosynthesis
MPQIAFTVQNLYCELNRRVKDFEIIVIDNYCDELQAQFDKQGTKRDKGSEYMQSLANKDRPWLKYLTYNERLSHWQAKNLGVQNSTGEFLFFCDSHCIIDNNSLFNMYEYYKNHWQELNGTLHLPISYLLERDHLNLIYKLVTDVERGVVHYSFTRYREATTPYQVPCMSTCGMMMHRSIYDLLGGWPTELEIYGGGEHFINFTMAILGKTINIYPNATIYHYAAPRGYFWNYVSYHRNRCIATYMFGGEQWAYRYIMGIKPHNASGDAMKESIFSTVAGSKACIKHRQLIQSRQTKTIATWLQEQMINLPADMIDAMPVEN